jgi:hypothetical protein
VKLEMFNASYFSKVQSLRDLGFSPRWRFTSKCSELLRRVVMWQATNVSEDLAASMFMVKMNARDMATESTL